ncbi:hypothetical protein FHS16_006007 [Paenibacillus endophyticus]|uniref:Uncharacterized protein n=1 Tax=Paenibacillus endophyticus TaxID=1294268 RepID=A0A7W5GDF6_9BACL|nr:hypothetical protein [Paenibacillus endophyticus]MBB3155891.1 hypothetical protein [Paenibacillus endophyticus]
MIVDLVRKAATVNHGYMHEIDMIDKENVKGVWALLYETQKSDGLWN